MKALQNVLLLLICCTAYSQKPYAVTFGELHMKMKDVPKPVVIKVSTEWCCICKMQDRQIEKSPETQQLLAGDYYYLELDAETRQNIFFGNNEYRFIPNGKGGIHELAATLCGANSSYPCWVFLSPEYEIVSVYNGLLKKGQLISMLKKR